MKQITFCIATANNEKEYTFGLLKSLEENTNFINHEILIFIDSDNQNTYKSLVEYQKSRSNVKIYRNTRGYPIGSQKNVSIMFYQATKSIVCYLQSDMVVCPNFDKYLLQSIGNDKNKIVSAARIEPPLHPPSPEKIVKNFGITPETFQYKEFCKFAKELQKENRPDMEGHFAPFALYKETYFNNLGGFDTQFRCSREDSDFIIRLYSQNLTAVQSWNACVYHYTCVSSRGKDWFKTDVEAELKTTLQSRADLEELKRFIRKWGYFGHEYKPRFDITLFVDINHPVNIELLKAIEPHCSRLIINDPDLANILISNCEFDYAYYANKRLKYTSAFWETVKSDFNSTDFKNRILIQQEEEVDGDVVVKINSLDLQKAFSERYQVIQNLNTLLIELQTQEDPSGKYEIAGLIVEVKKLSDINKKNIPASQYMIKDLEVFKFI
jgi:GT2 family glycosyltransferase